MLNTDALLDLLAAALSSRLSIFGLQGKTGPYVRITPRQLAKGRFLGGATRFVIDAEGVVFTSLKVLRVLRPA
jgi:hypothetical protein